MQLVCSPIFSLLTAGLEFTELDPGELGPAMDLAAIGATDLKPYEGRWVPSIAMKRIIAAVIVLFFLGPIGTATAGEVSFTMEEIDLPDFRTQITDIQFIPGTDEFLLAEMRPSISHYRLDGDRAVLLGAFDLPDLILPPDYDWFYQCGVYLELDPEYDNNSHFYVGQCDSLHRVSISRYTLDVDDYGSILATREIVIEVWENESTALIHNQGKFGFEESGTMWATFGDLFRREDSQNTSNLQGSLVRIIPREGGGYDPAPDNPSIPGVRPEIYAWGLRSPWTSTMDDQGRYWIADVGGDEFEELNIIDRPGMNLGWDDHEGPCSCDGYDDPTLGFNRSTSRAVSLWVAPQYEPNEDDPYNGHLDHALFYGDHYYGYIKAIVANTDSQITRDEEIIEELRRVTALEQGPGGYLYASVFGLDSPQDPGSIWRLVMEPAPGDDWSRARTILVWSGVSIAVVGTLAAIGIAGRQAGSRNEQE